eukprot:TRINITY_DN3269_c0_g3_i1.p1 TRINITY_DN3269_c0_g3~~TRINITY_DN3269_c0_g3_i1.p1  ORF type:complete len:429 (-),score=68.72 TRINITY_DN3269_c0_g3_i1:73-1188(-)
MIDDVKVDVRSYKQRIMDSQLQDELSRFDQFLTTMRESVKLATAGTQELFFGDLDRMTNLILLPHFQYRSFSLTEGTFLRTGLVEKGTVIRPNSMNGDDFYLHLAQDFDGSGLTFWTRLHFRLQFNRYYITEVLLLSDCINKCFCWAGEQFGISNKDIQTVVTFMIDQVIHLFNLEYRTQVWKRIRLIRGTITQVECDAIVNPADETLHGRGSMIANAIHSAAGPNFTRHLKQEKPSHITVRNQTTARYKYTPGYNLSARNVISICGPMQLMNFTEGDFFNFIDLLLHICPIHNIRTLGMPPIGSGAGGFPFDVVARTIIGGIMGYLKNKEAMQTIDEVIIVCWIAEVPHNDPYPQLVGTILRKIVMPSQF